MRLDLTPIYFLFYIQELLNIKEEIYFGVRIRFRPWSGLGFGPSILVMVKVGLSG